MTSAAPHDLLRKGLKRRILKPHLRDNYLDNYRLFLMGLITNLANPKIAVMYLSLLLQFITPAHGSVLTQSLLLGSVRISVSLVVNAGITVMAGSIAGFLAQRPGWVAVQRWMMGARVDGVGGEDGVEGEEIGKDIFYIAFITDYRKGKTKLNVSFSRVQQIAYHINILPYT